MNQEYLFGKHGARPLGEIPMIQKQKRKLECRTAFSVVSGGPKDGAPLQSREGHDHLDQTKMEDYI